jgi:hypothetical protein
MVYLVIIFKNKRRKEKEKRRRREINYTFFSWPEPIFRIRHAVGQ